MMITQRLKKSPTFDVPHENKLLPFVICQQYANVSLIPT